MKIQRFKSGGALKIPKNFRQNEQEQSKNIKAYTFLVREYGYKYELLSVRNEYKVKNPDALNLDTCQFSDAKIPVSGNGKNAAQNSIKEASKQQVAEVFMYFEKEYRMYDVWLGIKAAFQNGRAKNIETIIIKMKDGELKRYEAAKLRKIFKSKGKTN